MVEIKERYNFFLFIYFIYEHKRTADMHSPLVLQGLSEGLKAIGVDWNILNFVMNETKRSLSFF